MKTLCRKCGGSNVDFRAEIINKGATIKNVSIISKLCRLTLICCTCGLWLLVPKKKATQKNKNKIVTLFTCKECGYVWKK